VAIGIGLGLVIAALATRVVSSFLFGLSPTDGATYASTAAVLAVVGTIAAYLPARRVLRVNPVESLRAE
jgi:ABC-type antimicrobial peptide transport system permease subunit